MLSARHAAERLANCWHGGCQTVEQLRNSMQVTPCRRAAVLAAGQEQARTPPSGSSLPIFAAYADLQNCHGEGFIALWGCGRS